MRTLNALLMLVMSASLAASAGCAAPTGDDEVTGDDAEIATRRKPSINTVAWAVALLGDDQRPFCSGAVVDASWILTTRSCIEGREPGFQIAAGFEDLQKLAGWNASLGGWAPRAGKLQDGQSSAGQISTSDKFETVKRYDPAKPGNDLALVHLTTELDLSYGLTTVRAATLPDDTSSWAAPKPGAKSSVASWGGRDDTTWWAVSTAAVKVATPKGELGSTQLYGTLGAEVFEADRGGALTLDPGALLGENPGFLIGILSTTREKGIVVERVAPHLAWIQATIRGNGGF